MNTLTPLLDQAKIGAQGSFIKMKIIPQVDHSLRWLCKISIYFKMFIINTAEESQKIRKSESQKIRKSENQKIIISERQKVRKSSVLPTSLMLFFFFSSIHFPFHLFSISCSILFCSAPSLCSSPENYSPEMDSHLTGIWLVTSLLVLSETETHALVHLIVTGAFNVFSLILDHINCD